MKKFFFSLDTVLSYKEQVLDNLRGEHARAIARVRQCEQEIQELEQMHKECVAEFEMRKVRGMSIADMRGYENYLEALGLKIRQKQEQLVKLQEEEEKKREQVVEAKKETSSITKLKEKKQAEYDKMIQKQEELFIEEFVSNKRAAARASSS